jgi:hypothetical protein
MLHLPPPLSVLVREQRGLIARGQLLTEFRADVVDGHVRRGALHRVARGVYRVHRDVVVPGQRAFAAVLRAGSGAVLTGPAALGLWHVDGFAPDDPFAVLVPRGRRVRIPGVVVEPDRHAGRVVARRGDVAIAAPVDALLDTARWIPRLGERQVRVAYHHLRTRNVLTTAAVERRIAERGERDPAVRAFTALFDGDLRPESEGERRLGAVLARLRPQPEPQVWVTPDRRVDWYLRALRLGWEYHGGVDHGWAAARTRDRARDHELAAVGIRLLYVTAGDLDDETSLLATIAGAVAVRADELAVPTPRLV